MLLLLLLLDTNSVVQHHTSICSIPARGTIVDGEFFSTVPNLNFDICMISTRD